MKRKTGLFTGYISEHVDDDTYVIDEEVIIIDEKREYWVIMFETGETLSIPVDSLDNIKETNG